MGKIIAVVSGKGGTGKTTAVGALGSCLGALGFKTLCADCDAELRNLDITLGATHYLLPSVSLLSDIPDNPDDYCLKHPDLDNLWFLPSLDFSDGALPPQRFDLLFQKVRTCFDFCLLDAPAGIGEDVLNLLRYADEAIIVTTGDRSSLRDGQVMCSRLQGYGLSDIRLLVNRVEPRIIRREKASIDDMIDSVGARLLGIIREDETVPASANREKPLVLAGRKRAAQGFLRSARRLIGESIPISER